MRSKGLARISLACLALCVGSLAAAQGVRFSELHYDNVGTDVGELLEVSGPAGLDVTGWRVVLYNGANGQVYDTLTLSGVIPATCGLRGVVVVTPTGAIQNGSPDGMALVDASNTVREFLSYEGVMTGVGGPANGLTSIDIGPSETDTRAIGS
jgi:5'-nucleotidase